SRTSRCSRRSCREPCSPTSSRSWEACSSWWGTSTASLRQTSRCSRSPLASVPSLPGRVRPSPPHDLLGVQAYGLGEPWRRWEPGRRKEQPLQSPEAFRVHQERRRVSPAPRLDGPTSHPDLLQRGLPPPFRRVPLIETE